MSWLFLFKVVTGVSIPFVWGGSVFFFHVFFLFLFLRKINCYIFWVRSGRTSCPWIQEGEKWGVGTGCPLTKGIQSWEEAGWPGFFLATNAKSFVALCEWVFWRCCAEVLISHLGQNKQHKHGVWEEGTQEAMSTETHVKLQKYGALDFGHLDFYSLWWIDRGESAIPGNLGKGKHLAGLLCHAKNIPLESCCYYIYIYICINTPLLLGVTTRDIRYQFMGADTQEETFYSSWLNHNTHSREDNPLIMPLMDDSRLPTFASNFSL